MKMWYKPFTWVPPEFEKHFDKNSKEVVKVKKAGYLKLTHEPGTIIESGTKKGPRRYQVQKTGALRRIDMEMSRAERRALKHRGQTLTQKKG